MKSLLYYFYDHNLRYFSLLDFFPYLISPTKRGKSCRPALHLAPQFRPMLKALLRAFVDIAEKEASSKRHTQFKTKMAKIHTLFKTKTAENPHPFGLAILIQYEQLKYEQLKTTIANK